MDFIIPIHPTLYVRPSKRQKKENINNNSNDADNLECSVCVRTSDYRFTLFHVWFLGKRKVHASNKAFMLWMRIASRPYTCMKQTPLYLHYTHIYISQVTAIPSTADQVYYCLKLARDLHPYPVTIAQPHISHQNNHISQVVNISSSK